MNRTLRNLLIGLIVISGGIWGARRLMASKPVLVAVAIVEPGQVEATVTNTRAGTVKAIRRAKVAPNISGQVIRLDVVEGDRVRERQLLLELWNDDLKARLALAKSEVDAAEARLAETCRNVEFLERAAERIAELETGGIESEGALDEARTKLEAGQARCEGMRAALQVAVSQVAVAEAHLERTQLRAPFAGIVAEVNCEVGEIVSPSPVGIPTPPAIELIDPSSPYVSAPIDEVDAPAIRIGMPARISLDAMPGRKFDGQVTRVAPYVLDVEKQARTVEVEVRFQSPETVPGLLPGYSADAEVLLEVSDGVLRIPTQSIIEGNRVFVLNGDGILIERSIRTGVANWEYTEVQGGLTQGERVVVSVSREGIVDGARARAEATTARKGSP